MASCAPEGGARQLVIVIGIGIWIGPNDRLHPTPNSNPNPNYNLNLSKNHKPNRNSTLNTEIVLVRHPRGRSWSYDILPVRRIFARRNSKICIPRAHPL